MQCIACEGQYSTRCNRTLATFNVKQAYNTLGCSVCAHFWCTQDTTYILCLLNAGKQGKMDPESPLQKTSAVNGNSKGDLEAALPMGKSDSAADLASPPDHDPAKSVIYQDKMADQNAPQRSVKLDKSQRMFWGIGVAVLAGVVGSLFSPGFNVVTNDAFHTLAPGVEPLTVYTG